MNALSPPADFDLIAELRSGRRISAFLMAFVEVNGSAWPVCMRNISTAGALLEGEAGFPVGSKLLFRRAFAAVHGTVVWSRGGRFGLAFDRPLADEDVAALSRRIVPKS